MGRRHGTVYPVDTEGCHVSPKRQGAGGRRRRGGGVITGFKLLAEPQAVSVSGHQKPKMQEGLPITGSPELPWPANTLGLDITLGRRLHLLILLH